MTVPSRTITAARIVVRLLPRISPTRKHIAPPSAAPTCNSATTVPDWHKLNSNLLLQTERSKMCTHLATTNDSLR
jgi:hypothetical protein